MKPTIQEDIIQKAHSNLPAPKVSKDVSDQVMSEVNTNSTHPSVKTSKPNYKLRWSQTEKLILIELHIGGLRHEQVKVKYDEKSFELTIKDIGYTLELQLANPIFKNFCVYKVLSTTMEVKLKKDLHRTSKSNLTWNFLCKDGSALEKAQTEDFPPKSNNNGPSMNTSLEPSTSDTSNVLEMPTPKITHDWYQTDSQVIVEVRIKGLVHDQVKIEFDSASLSVTAKFPKTSAASGSEYSLELDLANAIVPRQCTYKVLSTKLEIKMKKQEGIRWSALEGNGSLDALSTLSTSNAGKSDDPTNKEDVNRRKGPKDWNNITKFLDSELEYLKDNQDAGDVFSMLYGDADEATKRAMNKSMQESGGTVLSTDWKDIGSRKVERMK